jgi:hypothetical protein
MSIYAEQNPNRTRDICFQNWPFRNQKWLTVFLKFSLWRRVPENWQVTRGFMLWSFLSWGIDYRNKSSETKFGRITSWTFNHPISHCALEQKFLFFDDMLDFEGFSHFGSTEGEGVGGEVSVTSKEYLQRPYQQLVKIVDCYHTPFWFYNFFSVKWWDWCILIFGPQTDLSDFHQKIAWSLIES